MSSFAELVDQAVKLEKEALSNCTNHADGVEGQGIKSLALTVVEMHKDHLTSLEELSRRGNLENLFSGDPNEVNLDRDAFPYRSGMPALSFLEYVMASIDRSVQLYEALAGAASDQELGGLLSRLTGEAGRTRSVVASRHDLETLSGS